MKIGIVELSVHGHTLMVESLTKIYVTGRHEIILFIHEKFIEDLKHLTNCTISIIPYFPKDQSLNQYFNIIKACNLDRIYGVTIEPYTKEVFEISKHFLNLGESTPIYQVVHHGLLWFTSPMQKFKNVLNAFSSFSNLAYRLKKILYYSRIFDKLKRQVNNSSGKYIVLSEGIANYALKFITKRSLQIIPFSIFDESMLSQDSDELIDTSDKILICIPGKISPTRRDYYKIISMLKNNKSIEFKEKIIWEFLGGSPPEESGEKIIAEAKEIVKLGYKIIFYEDHYLSMPKFEQRLAKCDIILDNLILKKDKGYGLTNESGLIFNMIKLAKPGLVSEEYGSLSKDFESSIIRYDSMNHLYKILLEMANNPSMIENLKEKALINSRKYSAASIYHYLEIVNE